MKAMTNEELEALIAKKEKSLAEVKKRLQEQKDKQMKKENEEIVAIVRKWHKEVSTFYDTHTDIITALNAALGTTDEKA